jgi:hypothetical protein
MVLGISAMRKVLNENLSTLRLNVSSKFCQKEILRSKIMTHRQ